MPRYKLTIEYDGSSLVGWQRQDTGHSVQSLLEAALERLTGQPVAVYGAGRTDARVHATAQVAHIDLPKPLATDRVRDAINFWLRPEKEYCPVAVLHAEAVSDDFHARFSAKGRRYVYRIVNRRPPLVLERDHAWWVPMPLDAEAMHEAAQRLVGHHDFTSFRASECQATSPMKTLDRLAVSRHGEEVRIEAGARSFLHHQVRNIVGSLKLVGIGKWSADKLQQVLEARDRTLAGPTAPAGGLYLTGVDY